MSWTVQMMPVRSDRRLRWVVTAVALAIGGAACGDHDSQGSPDGSERPLVVATTTIWADVVAGLVCDGSAVVETLVPAGADAHGFEPSLADRGLLDAASLVVANGLGLEEGLEDTIESAEVDGTSVIRIGEHIETISLDDRSGGPDTADPHVWLDPVRVAGVLPVLVDRLVREVGLDPVVVDACRAEYEVELADVDAELSTRLGAIPVQRRKLVTSHDSLGYLADRYGLEVVGSVIPATSTLVETNPAALEELAEIIEETGVNVIFAESGHSAADSEALAKRIGDVEIVALDVGTLGAPGSDVASYADLLRHTGRVIADRLG